MEEEALAFVAATVRSVWTLELLLLLRRTQEDWTVARLVAELRSSQSAVEDGLAQLLHAGLAVADSEGRFRYRAASPTLDALAGDAAALYAAKPVAVIGVIAASPDDKLRQFSDAFKLKE